MSPTKNLDNGSRYFSSMTDKAEAWPLSVLCVPDFVTLRISPTISCADKVAGRMIVDIAR